jgi:hypothetical protein
MTKNQKLLLGGLVGCLLLVICILAGGLIFLIVNKNATPAKQINSYEDCAAAGYPILESYPEQCRTPDGRSFTRELTEEEQEALRPEEPTPSPTPAPTSTTLEVRVYFSGNDSIEDPTYTVAVDRESNRTDIATFTIEELIDGPTATEELVGLFTPIELSGTSNCSGKDFTLEIDEDANEAILQFCKTIVSAGIGDDARIISTVTGTLTQFSTIDDVIILTKSGDCFGDESGMNLCLE